MLKHNIPILWKKEKMGIFTLVNDATGFFDFMPLFRTVGWVLVSILCVVTKVL
jgi:hypothetical protein